MMSSTPLASTSSSRPFASQSPSSTYQRPAQVPSSPSSKSLLFLSPEELQELAEKEHPDWAKEELDDVDEVADAGGGLRRRRSHVKEVEGRERGGKEEQEEESELWEDVANGVLWTVPFGFLFAGLDFAVHSQFGVDLDWGGEVKRLANAVPTLFILTLLLVTLAPSRRPVPLPPRIIQLVLLLICVLAGISTISITTTRGYLEIMKQAPGLATLWIWAVVHMELGWSVVALIGVAGGVWWRGEGGGVWPSR
ncbi:hypothetical protein MNV49_000196 [Pseudohyphozyma bogoriensis]|nr:hypothetical protein MNV49_000196 [Pseudohyphozyma bogoriensis]